MIDKVRVARSVTIAVFVTALFVLIGAVGNMDYQDALAEQAFYCEQVKLGAWPDYKNTYEDECNG